MASRRPESELTQLRRLAKQAARSRKERATTVHLLAGLCAVDGAAKELLRGRELDQSKLLRAGRTFDEPSGHAIEEALDAAKELAKRSGFPVSEAAARRGPVVPRAIHVLVVLLSNRRSAAYRALSQCGVDIARLRTAATGIAVGAVAPPRAAIARTTVEPVRRRRATDKEPASSTTSRVATPKPRTRRKAVAVPVVPPSSRRPARAVAVMADKPKAKAKVTAKGPDGGKGKAPSGKSPALDKNAASPADRGSSGVSARSKSKRSSVAKGAQPRSKNESTSAFELNSASFPHLCALGHNLTLAASQGKLDRIIGREPEVEQVLDILAKRRENSPLLVGPPGVGKTSVAHHLAQVFADNYKRTGQLRWLIELPITELLSGTGARGALAERLAAIRTELKAAAGRIVLFIDELHEMLAASGGDELVAELKAALAKGEMPLVATTTTTDHRRFIENDAALARRFSVVDVREPDEAHAFLVLRTVCEGLGQHHKVNFSDEAIASAVAWSQRYLPGKALPDKAIGLLDLAAARLGRRDASGAPKVEPEHVADIVAERADVPVERLLQTDGERMLELDRLLTERVVGHPEAATRIAAVLRRNAAGLRGRRPIGSFLLLGPTGVGKTETAKAIAEILFHNQDAMTRIDLSEYAEAHAVARLIGAPPGYVGHEAGGTLTEAVRKRPYQVVLLDELEKAHQDVLQSFLQVFDEGRLTDGRGRTVDLTNTVIVMTSNLGAADIDAASRQNKVGFAGRGAEQGQPESELRDIALRAARSKLPPELYNRIDEIIYYKRLERDHVAQIATRLLGDLAKRLAHQRVKLDIDPEVIERLMDRGGYDPSLGARPLRRAVARLIEAPLADMILRGELSEGSVVLVVTEGSGIGFDIVDAERRSA